MFKIFFVGIMTFVHMATAGFRVVVPQGAGLTEVPEVPGHHQIELHTAYIGFLMSDYIRSDGWGPPNPFKPNCDISELDIITGVEYGFYALDGFTITVSHAPTPLTVDNSHCEVLPHVRSECPAAGEIRTTPDKNVMAAVMDIDSGNLSAGSFLRDARFAKLVLNSPQDEIVVTATSFDGNIVRRVHLQKNATVWFGNEWSGKFRNVPPHKEHHHWMLTYRVATHPENAGGCADSPKPVPPTCPMPVDRGATAISAHMKTTRVLTECQWVTRAYTLDCSTSNYP